MIIGTVLIGFGLLILYQPVILVYMLSGLLIASGFTAILVSLRFRRMRQQSHSRFMNWIVRF